MAGARGSSIIMLRLNFMTAIYLPILLYAMSTYELEEGALTISERNLDAVAVPVERSLFTGDMFEAQILYDAIPPQPGMTTARRGGIESLARPRIEITDGPDGLYFDEESRKFVFNTENVFEDEPDDVLEKEISFSGIVTLTSIVDQEEFEKEFDQTFRVRRPTVQVISNAPQRLVQNSRNDLTFLVPGVSESDIVLHESSRNQTVQGNRLTWTPTGESTTVRIQRRNQAGELVTLDTREFSVVPPPPPQLVLRRTDGSGPIGPNDIVNPFGDELELAVVPDRQFYNDFPDDARYEISDIGIAFAIPGQVISTYNIPSGAISFNRSRSQQLGEFVYGPFILSDLNPNISGQVNQISIFIQQLERINFENRRIEQTDGFVNNFAVRTR